MSDRKRVGDYVLDIVFFAGMTATAYFLAKNVLSTFSTHFADPEKEKNDQNRLRAKANLQRLLKSRRGQDGDEDDENENEFDGEGGSGPDGSSSRRRNGGRPRADELELNEYENLVALEVVPPEDISVGFDDIGGLEDIIEELKESVIYPLTMPHLYSHGGSLLSAPSGVLLHGPPGCGKTMLAKALAHESGASFINLHISTMTEKWYGDSNKIVRAVFSLARKLQPAIIFIDEIDAVLGTRRSGEHEASGMVKAEFMTLWDGLTSANSAGVPSRIVVLGATNRMHDIDEAILRRMPKKFPVTLPGLQQRRRILQLLLGDTKRDADFDLEYVAKVTSGMSGSDLKELCRDAAMMPMRETLRSHRASGKKMSTLKAEDVRGLRTDDFFPRSAALPVGPLPPRAGKATTEASETQSYTTTTDDASSSRRRSNNRRSSAASSSAKRKTGESRSIHSRNGDDDEYEDVVDDSAMVAPALD